MAKRRIENIIVHCSDSEFGCAREIRNWHLKRGFRDIGYHFVILNGAPIKGMKLDCLDGQIECGRYLDEDTFIEDLEVGAHALGYNDKSIGVCLIGVKDFTPKQMNSLYDLLMGLMTMYNLKPDSILGHRETEIGKKEGKTCPNFDIEHFREIIKHDYFYGGNKTWIL